MLYFDWQSGNYLTEFEWVTNYGDRDFEENKKRVEEEENNKNKE